LLDQFFDRAILYASIGYENELKGRLLAGQGAASVVKS
jgi:hypothetical protein